MKIVWTLDLASFTVIGNVGQCMKLTNLLADYEFRHPSNFPHDFKHQFLLICINFISFLAKSSC